MNLITPPLRIAIVANIAWNIYNFRQSLIQHLLSQGFELVLIAQEDEYSSRLRDLGCRFVALEHLSRKGTNPIQDFRLILELKRIYQQYQINIALHFTIKANIYGAFAASWAGIKCLSVVTGLGYTFLHHNITARIARFLYKIAFKNVDTVVFQNANDQELFIKQLLCKPRQTVLIRGSGINCNKFSPSTTFSYLKCPFRFLFVGRLLYDKGIREYLQAARAVKKQLGAAVEFYILGELDYQNPAAVSDTELQNYVSNQEVIYVGKTDEVLAYIQNAHVVVLPSYREGLPRVLLEAAAAAKPIITTTAAGCIDMVYNNENGILVAAQSTKELANACLELYHKTEAELIIMGEAGRNYVINNFSDAIICQQFSELILKNS